MISILVLAVEKEENENICVCLKNCGFRVTGCFSVKNAYEEMYRKPYELIITEIIMPNADGFKFAHTIRQSNQHTPILFISSGEELPPGYTVFRPGVDDYIVKPLALEELLFRVRAMLRHANIDQERKLIIGGLELDADAMTVSVEGEEVPVTTREFNILYRLLSCPKKTLSREQLKNDFWGTDSDSGLRAVDVYVTRLRNKFSHCAEFKIVTVRGLGYKAVF